MRFIFWVHPLISYFLIYFYSTDLLNHQVLHRVHTRASVWTENKREPPQPACTTPPLVLALLFAVNQPKKPSRLQRRTIRKQDPSRRKHFPDVTHSPETTTLHIISEWQLRGIHQRLGMGRSLFTNLRPKMTSVEPQHSSFKMTEQEYS